MTKLFMLVSYSYPTSRYTVLVDSVTADESEDQSKVISELIDPYIQGSGSVEESLINLALTDKIKLISGRTESDLSEAGTYYVLSRDNDLIVYKSKTKKTEVKSILDLLLDHGLISTTMHDDLLNTYENDPGDSGMTYILDTVEAALDMKISVVTNAG